MIANMSVILSVLTKNAYKEFLLPATTNSEISIILSKEDFLFNSDLTLQIENINNEWFIRETNYYHIIKEEKSILSRPLLNGDNISIHAKDDVKISVLVNVTEKSFCVFEKYDLRNMDEINIGGGEDNHIIYKYSDFISKRQATLKRGAEGWSIENNSNKNSFYINSQKVDAKRLLKPGDCINIFSLRIIYLGEILAINVAVSECIINVKSFVRYSNSRKETAIETKTIKEKKFFHRAPRNYAMPEVDDIEIEAPPVPKEMAKKPLFMLIGPSFTMMLPMLIGSVLAIYSSRSNGSSNSMYMYTGIVTAAGSAVIGVFWALLNLRYSKKEITDLEKHRLATYNEYLDKRTAFIKEKYEKNRAALFHLYQEANVLCSYDETKPELWNRNRTHEDFLYHRLGFGNLPFQMKISVPKEKFTMFNDELAKKPAKINDEFSTLFDVPIGIDLIEHNLIGIVGGKNKEGAFHVARLLSAQIAANNCYTDVKMIFIHNDSNELEKMQFEKWLPHVWSEEKHVRYVASNKEEASDVLFELTKVIRMRAEENTSRNSDIAKPYYILFVSDMEMLEGELITKYIYENQSYYGLTTVILAENYEQLPNVCEYIIQNDDEFTGIYSLAEEKKISIKFDSIDNISLEGFARKLSRIEVKEVEKGRDIPNSLTFFEMFGINRLDELSVQDRWRKNRSYDNMKALVGAVGGGAPCYLDVHEKYHGPHGLIAGTTGSGKSETLQTYMLSLAINFSPDDIAYFIIDYKGGGMAKLFDGLPHLIGTVSNLSGNQVYRAIVSIKSEIKRRQRIFIEHNVNNINLYTKLYKNGEAAFPIPHMFIIIDEFAELKKEEPEFMKELISVAQVGRSLGLHLILATQKPSGTVDENIWSNSRFRLCLRVQDKQDSNDMLHKPDAAYITQTGRCYMQVGNDEVYQLFQSGWSGATYDAQNANAKTEIATMLSENGKAALVGSNQKRKQQEMMKHNWIKTLLLLTEQQLTENNAALTQLISDSSRYTYLFDAIEKAEIDYELNDYNMKRIDELLGLYAEAVADGEGDLDRITDRIIMDAAKRHKKLPEEKVKTQLDATIEYLGKVAEECNYKNKMQLWLPLLPKVLYLDDLDGYNSDIFDSRTWSRSNNKWNLEVPIGLCDDPENQAQMPLTINFAEFGHHAICGSIVSGKSTFVQSIIYALMNRYQPDYVNIYAIDFSSKMLSAFERAPHTGAIVYEDDIEKLSKLFHLIEEMMEERKKLFSGGNYSQYVRVNGVTIPSVLLVIDNYAKFRDKTENKYEDILLRIGREGVGYGIFMLITAAGFGSTEIQNKIGENIKTIIGMQLQDKYQYADVMRVTRPDVIPEKNIKGRGLAMVGERALEFQVALSVEAEDDFKRIHKIEDICVNMEKAWKGRKAKAVRIIPEKPDWKTFEALDEYQDRINSDRYLPVGYDMESTSVYSIDLSVTYCYLVAGAVRSGRSNVVKALIYSAARRNGEIVVIEHKNEDLCSITQEVGGLYIKTQKQQSDFFGGLVDVFKTRNAIKRQLLQENKDEEEIYLRMMQEKPYFIFISDIAEFVNSVMKPEENITNIRPFVENITEKGRLHNIYFIVDYNTDTAKTVEGYRIHENIASFKTGMLLGGNTAKGPKTFDFSYLSYTEQNKVQKVGIGMLPTGNNDRVTKVVLPQMKG